MPELVPVSCHVCGMWIEIQSVTYASGVLTSCRVCGMWIEIKIHISHGSPSCGHATYVACGLKYAVPGNLSQRRGSCHVCGMWIEIYYI